MIGVFDSGVGGIISYRELRRLLPREDILFLADRKNAPYGTKSKEELLSLVKTDIKRLTQLGAMHILIACCTASTVYAELSEEEKRISTPIIDPTALLLRKEAEKKDGIYRVYVIATEHTCSSHAFKSSVAKYSPSTEVIEHPTQELVSIVERGQRDGATDRYTESFLDSLSESIKEASPDALVLGCTHFSHLRGELERRLPEITTVSPAHIGARAVYNIYKGKYKGIPESGKSLYTE